MEYESWFDTNENKALIAVCVYRLTRNIGIMAIFWGVFNAILGIREAPDSMVNLGAIILGVLMLGAGLRTLQKPVFNMLFITTIAAVLLFIWILGITFLNLTYHGTFDLGRVILGMGIVIVVFNRYRKLQLVKYQVLSVPPEELRKAQEWCATLLKKKLTHESDVLQTRDGRCRVHLLKDRAFFAQINVARAFIATKDQIQQLIVPSHEPNIKIMINHPLGKLKYTFNQKNSEKVRTWLAPI